MMRGAALNETWWNDSPLTDRLSLTPPVPPVAGSALTLAAFDQADDAEDADIVTWNDWVHLLHATAGHFLQPYVPYVTITSGQIVPPAARNSLYWHEVKRSGDFALELAQVLQVDSTYGARLVKWQAGTVLQYEPEPSLTSVSVVLDLAPVSAFPVMTDDPTVEPDVMMMAVDGDDLHAMDALDRAADERYRAVGERDARSLAYNRD